MEDREFDVFLVEGDSFRDAEASIIRLNELTADEVDFLLFLISRQEENIDLVVRAIN